MKSTLMDTAKRVAHAELGVNIEALGESLLESSIRRRVRALHESQTHYLTRLLNDTNEQRALCQQLLVSESWFEREREPVVSALRQLRSQREHIAILSAPCARGEETVTAFGLALAAGFAPEHIEVDGCDASTQVIQVAKSFSYDPIHFRAGCSGEVEKLFEADSFCVREMYRERFHYDTVNVLAPDWHPRRVAYDLILCRNLLIYLTKEHQVALVEKLFSHLMPQGLLIVGAAESAILTLEGYNSRDSAMVFSGDRRVAPTFQKGARKTHVRSFKHPSWSSPPKVSSRTKVAIAQNALNLSPISALADQGKLDEAFAEGLQALEKFPNDSRLLLLLGLIAHSSGQIREAKEWVRCALEKDASYEEAQVFFDILQGAR